jgi:hypothetical protein
MAEAKESLERVLGNGIMIARKAARARWQKAKEKDEDSENRSS